MSKPKLQRKKLSNIEAKIKSMKNLTVKAGFPKENAETNSQREGVSALEKAVWHNYGLGNNPERPFMDIAYSQNKAKYKKEILRAYQRIETLDQAKFLNDLGTEAVGDIQESIIELRSPANAESTIKAKGSSNPLIDTGHMNQSVTYAVEKVR